MIDSIYLKLVESDNLYDSKRFLKQAFAAGQQAKEDEIIKIIDKLFPKRGWVGCSSGEINITMKKNIHHSRQPIDKENQTGDDQLCQDMKQANNPADTHDNRDGRPARGKVTKQVSSPSQGGNNIPGTHSQTTTPIVLIYYHKDNESNRIIKMNMSMCGFKNEYNEVQCVS